MLATPPGVDIRSLIPGSPPPAGHISSGSGGYTGTGLELNMGVAAALTDFLPLTASNWGVGYDVLRASAYYGSRHAMQIVRVLKGKVTGTLNMPLFGNAGVATLYCALGKDTYMAALAADPTTATTVNTGTMATHTVADSSIYTRGALATYGPTSAQQLLSIADTPDPTTVLTRSIKPGIPLSSGTNLQQIQQHKITPRGPLDSFSWDLPTLTVEQNIANQIAWEMAGVRVAKSTITGGKGEVQVANACVGTVFPLEKYPSPTTPTFSAFSPTVTERRELNRPFTIRDGYGILPNDQFGSGVSTSSRLAELLTWSVDWDNHNFDLDTWSDSRVKDNYPGQTGGVVKYQYAWREGRFAVYNDYLATEGAPPASALWTFGIDMRALGASVPVWAAASVYVPAFVITNAPHTDPLNNAVDVTVDGDIVQDLLGSPPLQLFVSNALLAGYSTIAS